MDNQNTNLIGHTTRLLEYIRLKQADERASKAIEISATLFLIAFFTIFALRPAIVTITGLVAEIRAKEQLSIQLRDRINSVIIAQEKYSDIQRDYNVIETTLPSTPAYAHAVNQLMGIAQKNGLSLDLFTFNLSDENKITGKNLDTYRLSFSLPADYSKILAYLSDLRANRRVLLVDNLQLMLDPKQQQTGSPNLPTLKMDFTVYYATDK